jgi:beta-alanine--pyruvate transaminase
MYVKNICHQTSGPDVDQIVTTGVGPLTDIALFRLRHIWAPLYSFELILNIAFICILSIRRIIRITENTVFHVHGAANIAAVVIEPIACSTGVLVPPKGYLKRIREICDRHQLLLIFDEVITGFGRTGNMFASTTFDVVPDMILFAKTVTNGAAPLGGVIVKRSIHDALMQGPPHLSELMHGYTYSGHPLACAAAIAMIDVIEQENLIDQVNTLSPYFEEAVHSLAELEQVVSVRNFGLAAGIELRAKDGAVGQRGFQAQALAFKHGVLTRAPGDTLVLAPPFITTRSQIDQMIDGFKKAIQETT